MTDRSANRPDPLLRVRHLTMEFVSAESAPARAVEDVSFDVYPGQTLGLVGESGCGKTTTMLSIMRLLPAAGHITSGEVLFDDIDLLRITERQMRDYRWKEMAMVFQGAMNALNPVRTVDDQISEAILLHEAIGREAADRRVIDLLDLVGIAKSRKNQYPHQYSGGMRQRAMIAMALICGPRLLIGDEPTTALDVTIEAQILDLIKGLQADFGMAIMYISHDLAVVGEMADEIMVMYLGLVMEHSSTDEIFDNPLHPYTAALWRSIPTIDGKLERLIPISGSLPSPFAILPGCRFFSRCDRRMPGVCDASPPELKEVAPGHKVRCFLYQ